MLVFGTTICFSQCALEKRVVSYFLLSSFVFLFLIIGVRVQCGGGGGSGGGGGGCIYL